MPLTIQPHHCGVPFARRATPGSAAGEPIVIALVNNMPDSALEATAAQFTRLLRAAAGPLPVQLRFCYLPEVPRGPEAMDRLRGAYWHIDDLLDEAVDALIVTGMEPKAARLDEEPYWRRFGELLDWAEAHTVSSVWSCLAAHAAVQLIDGIERRRLEQKRFGVFEHNLLAAHPMASGVSAPLATPHSRWNELPVAALRAKGYTLVSWSPETGADLFVKQSRSLLVFFQGHPEYEDTTLFREYRRDIGRFLRGEQRFYPLLPRGYLSPQNAALLQAFELRALAAPDVKLLSSLPVDAAGACARNTWSAAAVRIYRNWLTLIAAAKSPGRAAAV